MYIYIYIYICHVRVDVIRQGFTEGSKYPISEVSDSTNHELLGTWTLWDKLLPQQTFLYELRSTCLVGQKDMDP